MQELDLDLRPGEETTRAPQLIDGLSVVVPVYNSCRTLNELASRLTAVLKEIDKPYEVILVNDGSQDSSWDKILELSAAHRHLRGFNLMKNYGQHNALLAGIRQARHGVVVTIDDDLQHPPEEIPRLLSTLSEGYDVVYGTPIQQQHGRWRGLASTITKLALQSTMGAETARKVSAFRVFRTDVRRAFDHYRSPWVSIDVLLTWGAARFAAVPVRHDPRSGSNSNYTVRKLVTHALNMVTGFSTIPLQLASLIGFTFTFVGMCLLVYVVGRFIVQGGSVPGFPFLASTIAIFSGAQLFALGIMGEYLARIHFRMMERPSYLVRQSVNWHDADGSAEDAPL